MWLMLTVRRRPDQPGGFLDRVGAGVIGRIVNWAFGGRRGRTPDSEVFALLGSSLPAV